MQNRILIIIDAFTFGGAQRVLLALIPEWKMNGCEIEIVLIQDNVREMSLPLLTSFGVRVHRISARHMFDFRAIISLYQIANKFKPTQIQSHLFWAQIWGALIIRTIGSCKLIWVEHNTYLNRTRVQWLLFRYFAKIVDEVISVSFEVQEFLLTKNIVSRKVILNPISRNFTHRPEVERVNNFVFLGRLNDQKNPGLTIDAFDYAKSNGMLTGNFTLTICGDGPLFHDLKNRVLNLKSAESIFFTGQLTELETVRLLQSSICLVSTSKFEGFSLVRVEALATGAAVISTRTGGIKGILTKSDSSDQLISGVIITKPDIVEIARAMSEVLSTIYWSQNSIKDRATAANRHDPRRVAADYLVSFNKTDLNEDLG